MVRHYFIRRLATRFSRTVYIVISAAKVSATVAEVEVRTDPHAVPSFAAPSALSPAKSVLYLPPLLSSLSVPRDQLKIIMY